MQSVHRERYKRMRVVMKKFEFGKMARAMDAVCGYSKAALVLNSSVRWLGSAGSAGARGGSSLCPVKFHHRNSFKKGLAIRAHIGANPQTTPDGRRQAEEESKTKPAVPGLRDTVWDQLNLAVPSNPKLDRSISADVVVVGAGIAGISVAYNLAKAGKKVVLVESRAIGSGQSGRTTAHLMAWNDDYYHLVEESFGEEKSKLVGESHRGAIDWVERVVAEEGIDCNFRRVTGYLVSKEDSEEEAQKLRKEFDASKKAGFTDVKLGNLKTDPKNGQWGMALVFPGSAEFQPLLYIKSLAKAFKEKYGGLIFEQTAVVKQEGTIITTSEGHQVSAEAVVLATNSPINKNIAFHSRQYASTRELIKALKIYERASWWDTAAPYHYVRLEDKGDHEVLIVGGEDHETGVLYRLMSK